MSQLDTNGKDRLVSLAKGAAGALPFVGTIVCEVIDSVIPGLRFERVVSYLKIIDDRVGAIDDRLRNFQNNLKKEDGLDIFEEGIFQASRAVSEERKQRLARLVANALSADQLKYSEGRKLLNIYRELTDPEIIWLIYYSLNPGLGKGPRSDWAEKHPDVLSPISRVMSAPQEQHERGALQDSYKSTLSRLGLTTDTNRSTSLTTLGRLMVRYITEEES